MTQATERLFEFISRRGKSLPKGYGYQLDDSGNRFGLDVFAGPMRVDEAKMAVFVPYADGNARDGVGDLLEIGGIDHTRHAQNPIVLYDHGKEVTLPVGTAEHEGEYCIERDEQARTEGGWCHYYQGGQEGSHALFCEQLFDLQVKRLVRGGSLGYTITQAAKLPADPHSGTPEGLHLIRTKMLEFSVVVLPCNEDTVGKGYQREDVLYRLGMQNTAREILCLPQVCGKKLSHYLVKSLTPWLPPKKAQMGYEGKSCPCKGEGACQCPPQKTLPDERVKDSRMARTENTTGYAPGDKVAARELLRAGNFGAERYTFANPGERLDVVAVDPGGRILVRNKDRKTEYFSSAQLRKTKDMGAGKSVTELRKKYGKAHTSTNERLGNIGKDYQDEGLIGYGSVHFNPSTGEVWYNVGDWADEDAVAKVVEKFESVPGVKKVRVEAESSPKGPEWVEVHAAHKSLKGQRGKSLHALRKKYRPVAGVRRRLKKSTPGASMIHVRHKDVDAMREEADARGVKTHLAGEVPGGMKFKLTGDDESIDAVASLFGSRLS